MVQERYFYHSFPRRGAGSSQAIEKGSKILAAIRDFGLVLMPELIEWNQPSAGGASPRVFPVLQKRVCFTELSPGELPQHAEKFGPFALEFETDALRSLGAIPVFYIPQPTAKGDDGNAVGVALLGVAMDALAIIQRLAGLDKILNGSVPVAKQFDFNPGFVRSPQQRGTFTLDSDEAKKFIRAIGYATTPWGPLETGMSALLNFFYPADDLTRDKMLDYYRQREWRIACGFAINGAEVLHALTQTEKERLLEIDQEFFQRKLQTDLGTVDALSCALVHPGLKGRRLIDMVRRVIVPPDAVGSATEILAGLSNPPQVVSIDTLEAVR